MTKMTKEEQSEQEVIKQLARKMLRPAIGYEAVTVVGAIARILDHIRRTETDEN
jgi:hypothetical protein